MGRAPSSGEVRRASAARFAKALRDTANRFDRENPELRDQWGDHRTAINALVTWLDAAMADWLTRERVVLRGGGLDEAPQAYRRLPDVLDHHADTVRIVHELRPLGVAMASADEFDPYKD